MDNLTFHLHNFQAQERHEFKLYVKLSCKNKQSKLFKVLTLFYKGFNSKKICEEIYGSYPNPGYYGLRKRLMVLLLEYFAYEKGKELNTKKKEVQLLFESGKNLIIHKSYKFGFECLEKALSKSKAIGFPGLTRDILFEIIQFAHLNKDLELDKFLSEYQRIKELTEKQNAIAIAYAEVKQKLNQFFLDSNEAQALSEIDVIMKKQNLDMSQVFQYRTLYQFAQLSLAKSTATKVFLNELNDIEAKIITWNEDQPPKSYNEWVFKIKTCYLLASAHYRTKRFKESNAQINYMLKSVSKFNVSLSQEMYFKICVLKSLNTNYLGQNKKALLILDELLKTSKLSQSNKNWMDGYSVMSLILFHGRKYQDILNLYNQYRKSDQYYTQINGLEWVMRKNLILILTYFEMGDLERSKNQIKDFEKGHEGFLKENKRVEFYLLCVKKVVLNPFQSTNSHFHKFVESQLEKRPRNEEDIFVLSFFSWLKAKMKCEGIYESTLEIVANDFG